MERESFEMDSQMEIWRVKFRVSPGDALMLI